MYWGGGVPSAKIHLIVEYHKVSTYNNIAIQRTRKSALLIVIYSQKFLGPIQPNLGPLGKRVESGRECRGEMQSGYSRWAGGLPGGMGGGGS